MWSSRRSAASTARSILVRSVTVWSRSSDMKEVIDHPDVEVIEAQGFPLDMPSSLHVRRRRDSLAHAERPALSFFMRAKQSKRQICREFFEDVTRTATLFHALGATKDTVIAYILPNLRGMHLVIRGGQASGIVAAINPAIEPDASIHRLQAMNARIRVTLVSFDDGVRRGGGHPNVERPV